MRKERVYDIEHLAFSEVNLWRAAYNLGSVVEENLPNAAVFNLSSCASRLPSTDSNSDLRTRGTAVLKLIIGEGRPS